jgi:hypothetical protein
VILCPFSLRDAWDWLDETLASDDSVWLKLAWRRVSSSSLAELERRNDMAVGSGATCCEGASREKAGEPLIWLVLRCGEEDSAGSSSQRFAKRVRDAFWPGSRAPGPKKPSVHVDMMANQPMAFNLNVGMKKKQTSDHFQPPGVSAGGCPAVW